MDGDLVLGETRGIFSTTFWEELENEGVTHKDLLQALKDFVRITGECETLKPWFFSPDPLQAATKELTWGVNFGSKVVKPLLKVLYTRRTMKTELMLPHCTKSYPSDGMLPCTIRVEEVSYFQDDPYGILVHDQGMFYAQSLYSFENEAVPEHTQTGDGPAQETSQEDHMNFGAHRAGVISANDPRTVEMLKSETPAFYGDKRKLGSRFATLPDDMPMTQSRKRNAKKLESGAEVMDLGVEHIELLLHKTDNGGLHCA